MLRSLALAALLPAAATTAEEPAGRADWPMWGGRPGRNMVSAATGLPLSWDVKTGANVKWIAALGSQSYGNAVVSGGRVFVGTNNDGARVPDEGGDRGVLLALDAGDGRFLWQASFDKLASGAVNDWPYVGLCSSPLVRDDRVYFVSNRGQVVALDAEGFRDGENDGPLRDEPHDGPERADFVWVYDMVAELGVFPHNMSATSPVALGELLFVGTSNGQDESHENVPSPDAPALIALDARSGALVWRDDSVGRAILHGQWSAAAAGAVGEVEQVVIGQGDGWVRGFAAATGERLWEFDTNPKDAVWPRTRNNVIATPVLWNGRVFIANGQDPENGEGVGHLYAIDATRRGDVTEAGRLWHDGEIRRSISTAAVHEGVLYYPDFSGFLHAFDVETGERLWTHDTFAAIWGSALVADGRVYLGDEDGDVVVLRAGRAEQVLSEPVMGEAVYSTPVAAAGVLYLATASKLYALERGAGTPPGE